MHTTPSTSSQIIRLPEVLVLTGYKRSTLYNQIAQDQFPKPIKLGSTRCVGWKKEDVLKWIAQQTIQHHEPENGGHDHE